jgi:hypothetical protein
MQRCHVPIVTAILLLAGCTSGATPSTPSTAGAVPGAFQRTLKKPVVLAFDDYSGRLEYWPISRNGGASPQLLGPRLEISNAAGMVADGDVLSIASSSPPELVTYDIDAKKESVAADPFGIPIDIAIDRNATRYVLDTGGVTVYKAESSQPYELTCGALQYADAIGVDNEGDVFINGYHPGTGETAEVVEFAAGSSSCTKVPIKQEKSYVSGIGVDPKTDDLIIVDNVSCAGGLEGSMRVYSRPYGKTLVRRRKLRANCPGPFRLDAGSTHLLFPDTASYPQVRGRRPRPFCRTNCVTQRTYNGLREPAIYTGNLPVGLTTIPNTLPN